ncbi:MAG: hypothetical protein ACE3L7_33685 [Candidatus Pristimantibacillus sp.]
MIASAIGAWIREHTKYRLISFRIKRHSHYQLQMICDAINEKIDVEYEITPEMLSSRVMQTFIEEAFSDSTSRIVDAIVPELRTKRSHVRKSRKSS